jgi:NAD(P)H-quinone oxidoreductase subunit 5
MAGARRLSLSTSGRVQGYALTVLVGVLLMGAWILIRQPAIAPSLLRF